VVYEVRAQGNALVFYYPGVGKPLWKMTAVQNGVSFSGRVEGVVNTLQAEAAATLAAANPKLLKVPALPVI
jgi:hypothetical protein